MAENNPAIWLQAGSHSAEQVRRWTKSVVPQAGVSTYDSLTVTQNGTPNMSVDVATGGAYIEGTESTYQGTYYVENRGVVNLAIATSDPTNARIDIVVARVEDSAYSGATDAWSLEVITGTPSGSPSAPTAPSNSFVLAHVAVAATVTTIVTANITDKRHLNPIATGLGGVATTEGAFPSNTYPGQMTYDQPTGRMYVRNSADTAWIQAYKEGTWVSFSPTLKQGVTVAKTNNYARYIKNGRTVHCTVRVITTAGGTGGAAIILGLPFTPAATEFTAIGAGMVTRSGIIAYAATAYWYATDPGVIFQDSAQISGIGSAPSFALVSGDTVTYSVTYESLA